MNLHREISFEDEICGHLAANGWLYTQGDAAAYDRHRALFPADLIDWLKVTQPQAWETLSKHNGAFSFRAHRSCSVPSRLGSEADRPEVADRNRHAAT